MATDHPEARARRRLVFWHELRSPFGTLQTLLDVLADEVAGPLTVEQRDLLERARRQVHRASELVSAAHDAERLAAGRLAFADERVDLAAAAHLALAACAAAAAAKGLEVAPGPDTALATRVDPVQARRCLAACARAAIECARHESALEIHCRAQGTRGLVQFSVAEVADAGATAEGTEPWSTLGLKGGALGLYEARLLTEAMGGTLRVCLGAPGDRPAATIELAFPLR